jgi:hypothetical protein
MTCPYRWFQFAWACTFVCAVGCLFLLTSCQIKTPHGYTITVTGDAAAVGIAFAGKFGGGKEARRVLP